MGALPILVTLGIDDTLPSVKVWNLKHKPGPDQPQPSSPNSQNPSQSVDDMRFECCAMYRLQSDSRPTVMSVREAKLGTLEMSQVAIGFEDGSVTILSGDIARERANRVRVAPAPGEMSDAKPIVYVKYCGDILYCVSELSVVVIVITKQGEKDLVFRRDILDNLGALNPNLCCTIDESAELVVAREEALYFFNRDGRGPCLAFPTKGEKSFIENAGNYLIHSTGPGSVTAYDVVNKLIAYRGKGIVSCSFHSHLRDVRNVLLCFEEGAMVKLSEIPLEDRVNLLLKRGLYVPAVALARAESGSALDPQQSILIRALRQYAEYLMSKDRYNEAAEQLVETIQGNEVEPSWVITRLVEQSGLRSGLRLYLEALHAAGKAAFVHTKVLITCYRHDRARGAILGSKATEKTTDEYVINVFSDLDWTEDQVDAAIKLCRDAGLYKVAERVSRRRGRYEQLARTLVEDLDESEKALALLRSLQDRDALRVIQACGRELLTKDPVNFVDYLADAICRSSSHIPLGMSEPVLQLNTFLPLFIDLPRWRAVLLERVLSAPGGITPRDAPRVWILLFESLVCVDTSNHPNLDGARAIASPKPDDTETLPPIDNDETRSMKSEASGLGNERRSTGRRALKILQSRRSLLDLRSALDIAEQYGHEPCLEYLYEHLRLYRELGICLRMSEKGEALLRACRRHGDREPLLWMECIRLYGPMAAREAEGLGNGQKSTGKETGEEEGVLVEGGGWTREGMFPGFMYGVLSEEGERSGGAQEVLDEAMVALERSGALSAVEIVDVVTEACDGAMWGIVREFFERACADLRKEAGRSEHEGLLLQTEMKELQREAKRLAEEPEMVNLKTCSACGDTIGIPLVYFFCKHAYNAGCLTGGGVGGVGGAGGFGMGDGARGMVGNGSGNGSDEIGGENGYGSGSGSGGGGRGDMWGEECPKCAPELDAMVSMRQALQEKNTKYDEFFGVLDKARDGFAAIVEFLERSPFI